MKFPLIHTGRRFFFFTFVVEGRRAVLSRLERGARRPALLPAGERVAAVWRALHKIEPHFTASDFVIMPDHVHLLLIVNSEGEFRFNPLVFAHWFLRATGGVAPRTPQSATGDISEPPTTDGGLGAAGADLRATGGVAPRTPQRTTGDTPEPPIPPAGGWAAYFGGGSGAVPPSVAASDRGRCPPNPLWSRDFWVDITFDSRQLAAVRRYIKMNPARYFWKLDNPDMFRLRSPLRHPVLDPALPWSAAGDITILASPFLYLVRLAMKKTAAELEDEIAAHVERARRGWTPVCGFISPGEREFERRLKALPNSRWVKTVPYGLPERYDPSVEDSRWLAAHRQLVLSSFDRSLISPFKITRRGCLAMNERIAAMAAKCRGETP